MRRIAIHSIPATQWAREGDVSAIVLALRFGDRLGAAPSAFLSESSASALIFTATTPKPISAAGPKT
jgi:hypothetical protein